MGNRLVGRVAVVTGGSRGIGRAITERFVTEGAQVIVADLSAPQDSDGGVLLAPTWHRLDVTDSESIHALVDDTVTRFGGIDILVNNAGVMFEKTLEEQTQSEWDQMMAVNLRGPFLMAKHVVPQMRKRGGGAIVNIGSVEGFMANSHHTGYAASKAGLHGLTIALAVDLGRDGIRCNAVCPGWIDTELNKAYVDAHPDRERVVAELGHLHPVGRIGTPRDVANAVVWLASEEAGFVSGALLTIDGARTRKVPLPPILQTSRS